MVTNKDTENSTPSAPTPADNDITMLPEVTEQDIAEAIEDEFGAIYSKDGKRLYEFNKDFWGDEDDIVIRDGTEIIWDDAFSDCTHLESLNIPPSVTIIGHRAFEGCSGLTSINIPSGVTAIGHMAFEGCSSLTSINIPSGVTTICCRAFRDCKNLTSITIPDNAISIGDGAFEGCI